MTEILRPGQQLDQILVQEPTRELVSCTGVVVFDGDEFLAFQFAKDTTVGVKWGIPGGHNELDFKTGEIENGRKTGSREMKEETAIFVNPESLHSYEGDEFIQDMSRNGSPKWMKWKLYYTHEYSGEVRQMQPLEGKPEWMKIQAFFDLPDDEVAPNAKMALLYALIDSAKKS